MLGRSQPSCSWHILPPTVTFTVVYPFQDYTEKTIHKLSLGDLFPPILLSSPDYNVEFFRQFILVMNALDNRGKMITCLIASSSHCTVSELVPKCELKLGPNETKTAGVGGG